VIAERPVVVGADQVTVADAVPATAATFSGGLGAVGLGSVAWTAVDTESPAALNAVTR
jgi:hypothetical protein